MKLFESAQKRVLSRLETKNYDFFKISRFVLNPIST